MQASARLALALVLSGLVLAEGTRDAEAQNWFDAPRVVAHPLERLVAGGDFDGDQAPDLVGFDPVSSHFRVLSNDGAGGFLAGAPVLMPASGTLNGALTRTGDFDGDGSLDLVFAVDNQLSIHLSGAGMAGTVIGLASNPADVEVGDSNGDGRDDLAVVVGFPSTAFWIRHDGVQFQTSPSIAGPSGFTSVVATDVDGDGTDDMILAVWLVNDLLFVPTVAGVPTVGGALPLGVPITGNKSLEEGDVDGDGDEDVVVVGGTGGYAARIQTLIRGVGPTWTLAGGAEMSGVLKLFEPARFHVCDWDGDGDGDLVSQVVDPFSTEIAAVFLANDGASGFTDARHQIVSRIGFSVGVFDFDQDGFLDLAAHDEVVFGDGTFEGAKTVGFSGWTLDRDDDGDLDVAYHQLGVERVRTNLGEGVFTTQDHPFPPLPPNQFLQGFAAGDFDGDGRSERVMRRLETIQPFPPVSVFKAMERYEDDGSGALVAVGPAAPPSVEMPFVDVVFVADVDADGDLDLVADRRLWRNDGSGFFPGVLSLAPQGEVRGVADADADGDADVLLHASGLVHLLRNHGALGFAAELLFTAPGGATVDDEGAFLDLDGDLDPDVVVSTSQGSLHSLHVIENQAGTFAAPVVSSAGPWAVENFGVGDADGDGIVDLFAQEVAPSGAQRRRFVVFRRPGAGLAFEAARAWLGRGSNYRYADLDQDGDTDVAAIDLHLGRRFGAPENGRIRQYGVGVPGTGGAVPVLGGTGPLRVGAPVPELRLRRAVGGTFGVLAVGFLATELPNLPAGTTSYVDQPVYFVLPLPGPLLGVGQGEWTIPLAIPSSLTGVSLFLQTFVADPAAPFQLTATNGLEVRLGT